jgi:nucleoside-diphosphate-sugar epimerase
MNAFVGEYGVDAIALRFAHVYGPGRTTQCFVRDMFAAAAGGRRCRIPQASGSLRQYVHITDVIDAIDLAMRIEAPAWRVFNISADELQTLAETADAVRSVAGALDVAFDESSDLPNYRIGKLSIHRARTVLGYQPRLPLQAGLRDYWRTFSTADRSR